jgi:hypothetical protein
VIAECAIRVQALNASVPCVEGTGSGWANIVTHLLVQVDGVRRSGIAADTVLDSVLALQARRLALSADVDCTLVLNRDEGIWAGV